MGITLKGQSLFKILRADTNPEKRATVQDRKQGRKF